MSTVLEQVSSVPTVVLEAGIAESPGRPCVLLGIGFSEIHLQSQKWIAPGTPVRVGFEHIAITGEILYCKPREKEWLACVGFTSDEKSRNDPRFPIRLPANIISLGDSGSVRSNGQVTDISRSGLGLTAAGYMATGSMICVETESILVIGTVRYCHPHTDGVHHNVGMEITDILHGADKLHRFDTKLGAMRKKLAEFVLGHRLQTEID